MESDLGTRGMGGQPLHTASWELGDWVISGDNLRAILILSGDVLPSSQNLSCIGRGKLADPVVTISGNNKFTRYPIQHPT